MLFVRRTRVEGWLQDGSLTHKEFSRARLAGADLSDANLSHSDLSFADLRDVSLRHANLRGTNFVGANLTGADLRWADLTRAQLMWSDLRLVHFEGTVLTDVDASFASIDPGMERQGPFAGSVTGGYLTSRQISLIRSSFDLLLEVGEPAIERFYQNLFESMPEVRSLFPNSMKRQTRKFLQSLRLIVSSLDQPERGVMVLQQLGERHRGYGVRDEYYGLVGGVLLNTLDQLLGEAFTEEVREAWGAAYGMVSGVMTYTGAPSPAPA